MRVVAQTVIPTESKDERTDGQPAFGQPIIGLAGASKIFGGTVALKAASFALNSGEVLALLGENGAGKSTCVKMMAGVYRPSVGSVVLGDKPVIFASPLDAQKAGVAVMHQHPGLFPDLSVAENVFMGHMPRLAAGGIDIGHMDAETARLLNTVGLSAAPDQLLGTLRTSEQQLVEIARALSLDARVLIMDEPTAALSQREVSRLFQVVADLKRHGVAMMFVGHRMDEIFRIADRIAVLRDGALIGVERAADLPRERAIQMMVGRELSSLYPRNEAIPGDLVLETQELGRAGEFSGITISVRKGKSWALAGWLVRAARKSRARCSASRNRQRAEFSSRAWNGASPMPARPWQRASAMSPKTGWARVSS